MTTKKLLTAACALALGLAWTMAPAIAADESVKDKAKDKMDTAKDKVGNAAEKTKDKAVEIKDKTKEKAVEIKDKIKDKVSGKKNGDTVAKGSDDVRQAQQALTDKGFNPGPVDGLMGPHTKAAISDYQKKENLKVTGRLDHETKSRLVNASVSKKAETTAPAASPSTDQSATTTEKK
jgi:peptidoglycan hydrolase-like protein with peptidoglycan-binding domain